MAEPVTPLDEARREAEAALAELPPHAEDTRITSLVRCARALRALLAALDADKPACEPGVICPTCVALEEAEGALEEISAECTEPPFMGDGSLVSARRIKGMCDRYFARREGEKGEDRG